MSYYTKEKLRVKLIVAFSLLVSILFFFFNLTESAALFYVGLLALFSSIFLFSAKESFLLIAFLIPNLFMFKQIGSKAAILGYFFMAQSLKFFMESNRGIHKVHISFVAHILLACITCVLYSDSALALSMVRFAFNFSLFTYCATLFQQGDEIKQVLRMYFAGTIVAIAMGIIFNSYHDTLYNGFFSGVNSGRNYFGAVISPAITFVIIYFMEKRISVSDVCLYIATVVFCIISIILSRSRTSVLGLAIPAVLLIYYYVKSLTRINNLLKSLLLGVLIVVSAIYIYRNYYDAIMDLLARFEGEDVETGNNRFILWQYYFERSFQTPLAFVFGSGSNSDIDVVEHNTILQCFYELGVFGIITMFGVLKNAFTRVTKGKKLHFAGICLLLSIGVPYSGINGLYADQLSFLFILCALIICDLSETKKRRPEIKS